MEELDRIKEKILKLLKLKEGALSIGSIEEAANAAEKIQTIVLKYNIDLAELENVNIDQVNLEDEYIWEHELNAKKKEGKWLLELLYTVANNTLCKAYYFGYKRKAGIRVIGTKINLQLARFIFDQLRVKLVDARRLAWKSYIKDPSITIGIELKGKFTRNFYAGAVLGIFSKYQDIKRYQEKAKNQEWGLVLSHETKIAEYVEQNITFAKARPSKKKSKGYSEAYYRGYQAGKSTDITQGINS